MTICAQRVTPSARHGTGKPSCACKDCARPAGVLQRTAVHQNAPEGVPAIVYDVLRSPGQPLDRETREFMEERFDHDFSAVRIHTDSRAAESARAVNAQAYTVGSHIAVRGPDYSVRTASGRRLLAHELAHVVQQGSANSKSGELILDHRGTIATEDEAEAAASSIDAKSMHKPNQRLNPASIYLLRQAAEILPQTRVAARSGGRAALQLVKPAAELAKLEGEIAIKSAARAGGPLWRMFWRVIARRYAVTLALAEVLAVATGPLPIGLLIDLGLAGWAAWDIYKNWDSLWKAAAELKDELVGPDQATADESATSVAAVQENEDLDEETPARRECKNRHSEDGYLPMNCDPRLMDKEAVVNKYVREFYSERKGSIYKSTGKWKDAPPRDADVLRRRIDACDGANGRSLHRDIQYQVYGSKPQMSGDVVSVFECPCCDAKGGFKATYRWPHISSRGQS